MTYVALRDFDGFKKGDSIPAEIVQDRLIRGKKIGLADCSKPVEVLEIKEELITEVLPILEVVTNQEKEEILLEDSSAVMVEIEEEIVEETPVKETKKSKK